MKETNHKDYVDHEVRLKVLEHLSEKTFHILERLENKMDNQFKWIIGTIITMIGGLIVAKIF
jgi:hypothetical protein